MSLFFFKLVFVRRRVQIVASRKPNFIYFMLVNDFLLLSRIKHCIHLCLFVYGGSRFTLMQVLLKTRESLLSILFLLIFQLIWSKFWYQELDSIFIYHLSCLWFYYLLFEWYHTFIIKILNIINIINIT